MQLELTPEKKIIQHNAITSGRYDYNACQLDIVFVLLATIDKSDLPTKAYSIHLKDIEAITGRKWDYGQFKNSVSDIGKRDFFVSTPDGEKQIWLFDSALYKKSTGCVDITLGLSSRQYFFDLKDNFTVMQLRAALACSSKYAKRLYAISCQWRSKGSVVYKIDKLKEMLFLKDPKGIEKEQFTEITALKKKVLDIAMQQINSHTDMEISYELIKKGRAFTDIKFILGKREVQPEIDFKESIEHQKTIASITAYGLSKKQAEDIVKKRKVNAFSVVVDDLRKNLSAGNIKPENITAYLVGVLQNKGIL